jgi:hypothetical protein
MYISKSGDVRDYFNDFLSYFQWLFLSIVIIEFLNKQAHYPTLATIHVNTFIEPQIIAKN